MEIIPFLYNFPFPHVTIIKIRHFSLKGFYVSQLLNRSLATA